MDISGIGMAALAVVGVFLLVFAATIDGSAATRSNRLIHETSPYLLQHAHNPVDWHPWGEEAFETARAQKKMIFLSIGYSTCHWCHVMERESFEDEEVAVLLNKYFIAIKVDREERPDVDQVYMAICQSMTGQGGWPLNIFLTSDRKPFYAGTYFPKQSRYGRLGMMELLARAGELWKEDPGKMRASGQAVLDSLRNALDHEPGGEIDQKNFTEADKIFIQRFDPAHGGFGSAPKFPTPHNLTYLLRRARSTGKSELERMALKTLDEMRKGGIYDHLGYGFHRYSTDVEWLLPHFEKMLYDQAGLALAYLEAYQATGEEKYSATVREILAYVVRDIEDAGGGFHSAEDADSEGVEGLFYVWKAREFEEALGGALGKKFAAYYGVSERGNFLDEATREPTGLNILHRGPVRVVVGVEELAEGRRKLLAARNKRVRPHKDDKVLSGWNGLMISAFARSGAVLENTEYIGRAVRAMEFVLESMLDGNRLLRTYREGKAAVNGFAEDYAFLTRGMLDLYAATLDVLWLERSLVWAGRMVELFWDNEEGGLFDSGEGNEELALKPKEIYDGAMPSANSVALEIFARLWRLTGDKVWEDRGEALVFAFAKSVGRFPAGYSQLMQGVAMLGGSVREVVIVGPREDPATRDLIAATSVGRPGELVVLARFDETVSRTGEVAPYTSSMSKVGGRPAAYVCSNFSCYQPLTDPNELRETLAIKP